ncbi:hypothetical protein [Paenibacillus sp. FSL H3-0333]|uniref:hypothetical protein n=1 Tax=Paenibacillus sp. FSL H3-0333 TaxID=2921373 RepID=UPI0030F5F0AF
MNKPEKINEFMRGLMKEASRNSLIQWLEWKGITNEQYGEIERHFWEEYNIRL